jgi:hypothetical protein
MALDCSPCFDGRPDYNPAEGTALLPIYNLARSRLFDGGTFFRSKLGPGDTQGIEDNDIALAVENTAIDEMTLIVYYLDVEVERYAVFQVDNCTPPGIPPPPAGIGTGVGIPALRAATASSEYISMPPRATDAQDPCVLVMMIEVCPEDDPCLSTFAKTNMTGGSGPTEASVPSIRTGPDRTFIFIDSKEDDNGTPFDPGPGQNLNQWNFDITEWVAFVIDQACRPSGTDC